jgi:putative heme iron utilization protein
MEPQQKKDLIQPTDAEAIRLAKSLIRTARHGALATLEPQSGRPQVTRVGDSTDTDGVPVILISKLAAHTPALHADPRCSLLLGSPGKGDPLAHARISIACTAHEIARDSDDHKRIDARYLSHQQKARIYASLPDFNYFRLVPESAALNGGFGRAYAFTAEQLVTESPGNAEIAGVEMDVLDHMNDDHASSVLNYARHFAKAPDGRWQLVGFDAEGFEIADGDDVRRIFFDSTFATAQEVTGTIVRMARDARVALGDKAAPLHGGNA